MVKYLTLEFLHPGWLFSHHALNQTLKPAHLPLTHPFFTGPPYPLSITVNQVSSPKIPNYNIDNEWLSAVKQSTFAQYINVQLMNASIFNPWTYCPIAMKACIQIFEEEILCECTLYHYSLLSKYTQQYLCAWQYNDPLWIGLNWK